MVDYSQHGQALILQQLISTDTPRILVDIGAHDGMTGSNSRTLVEMGWQAVLIEPLPMAFAQLQENCQPFPEVSLLRAACSDHSGVARLRFGADGETGQWSSISDSPNIARNLGAESCEVETITLADVFRIGCIPSDFGVLLVDTEGLDLRVLQALRHTVQRPRIIVTEEFEETDAEKYAFLSGLGYGFMGVWGSDSLWVSASHPADSTSLRLPILRLPAVWKPSGAPSGGEAYLDGISRQCITGWAFCESTRVPPPDVVLVLHRIGSPQRYVFQALRSPRADVAHHFRSRALWMSGFRACIDAPPGEYEMHIIQQDESSYSETIIENVRVV